MRGSPGGQNTRGGPAGQDVSGALTPALESAMDAWAATDDIGDGAAADLDTIAFGVGADASAQDSIAIGQNSLANAANAIAIGEQADAGGLRAIAIGQNANASGADSLAIGNGNATASRAVIIGSGGGSNTRANSILLNENEVRLLSGGTIYGGDGAGENLDLASTVNATKGLVRVGATPFAFFDEVNARVGLGAGAGSPTTLLKVQGSGSKGKLEFSDASFAQLAATASGASAALFQAVNTATTVRLRASTSNSDMGTTNSTDLHIQTGQTDRAIYDSAGNVALAGLGGLATTATDGFPAIPSGAGAPTGTPTAISTNMIQMYYDRTNNRIYFYNGAWRSVAVA